MSKLSTALLLRIIPFASKVVWRGWCQDGAPPTSSRFGYALVRGITVPVRHRTMPSHALLQDAEGSIDAAPMSDVDVRDDIGTSDSPEWTAGGWEEVE